ncbi:MAG: hypothetical protein HY966_00510, partial [Ignavibacteriales bacterium]|nr:hypothetical protein [Ignavibacteriales bacterium]
MMIRFGILLILLSATVEASAGSGTRKIVPMRSHQSALSNNASAIAAVSDTLRLLAIMVDFVADNESRTSDSGKFLLRPLSGNLDPPPHDAIYFQKKFEFVRNYFRKVSNGKLIVSGTVLNRVVSLPKSMSDYSPPSTSTTFTEVAQLAIDSWRMADSLF